MKKNKVKMKIVIGFPNEVINVLSDLIQKGEVNLVLFSHYELFSPDELEKQLLERVSINGWECDYLYSGNNKMEGLSFYKQGKNRIKIEDVFEFFSKGGYDIPMVFPEGVQKSLCDSINDFVVSTVPELIKKGLSMEDVLSEDYIWDCVDRVEDLYLEGEVQELFKLYKEKGDRILMDYIYWGLYYQMEHDYGYNYVDYSFDYVLMGHITDFLDDMKHDYLNGFLFCNEWNLIEQVENYIHVSISMAYYRGNLDLLTEENTRWRKVISEWVEDYHNQIVNVYKEYLYVN